MKLSPLSNARRNASVSAPRMSLAVRSHSLAASSAALALASRVAFSPNRPINWRRASDLSLDRDVRIRTLGQPRLLFAQASDANQFDGLGPG